MMWAYLFSNFIFNTHKTRNKAFNCGEGKIPIGITNKSPRPFLKEFVLREKGDNENKKCSNKHKNDRGRA